MNGRRSNGSVINPGAGKHFDGSKNVVPTQAPTESVFEGKFQYIRFDDPLDLTDDQRRTLGFYNHAYAPIGNENALYTPMPGDMFRDMYFEDVLLPDAQKMSMVEYVERYQPQKTYMSLAYFQELFRGTLPRSYAEPKKKLKTEHQDIELEPDM